MLVHQGTIFGTCLETSITERMGSILEVIGVFLSHVCTTSVEFKKNYYRTIKISNYNKIIMYFYTQNNLGDSYFLHFLLNIERTVTVDRKIMQKEKYVNKKIYSPEREAKKKVGALQNDTQKFKKIYLLQSVNLEVIYWESSNISQRLLFISHKPQIKLKSSSCVLQDLLFIIWVIKYDQIHAYLTLQKRLVQLPAVDMQHAPSKLPSKLHMVTVHQILVESILENVWSNNRSFLGVSAYQLQAVEQVFFCSVINRFQQIHTFKNHNHVFNFFQCGDINQKEIILCNTVCETVGGHYNDLPCGLVSATEFLKKPLHLHDN
ncbi:hypothetical protein VP01_569g3 [Puccinia sorghi]|uniref:Uncharacterized protein n=1 Tax=Puccinia sorghi TaxID=27349 RepID=A0A0L6UKS0_9BASI|nr:hypothetical protein VP01_569g3 [Puccinia sorghi]